MTPKITFLGGAGTVTGSKFLLETGAARVLVDCGLFQGYKNLRQRNWDRFPVDPASIDAVVLTHAHLDHSGYIPLLARNGFSGPVVCTDGTADLCAILLPDSGFLHEKDAEYANRRGFSKHHPALPLYTRADAETCLEQFSPTRFGALREVAPGVSVRFHPAGHILGAAIVEADVEGRTVVFSGDLGRKGDPTMQDPAVIPRADYVLVESTYGDRLHDTADPEDALADVITRTAARGGTVLIPAFAVGRTQSLLFHLDRLKAAKRIPEIPIFLDSPMAISASEVFFQHADEHRLTPEQCARLGEVARFTREVEESKSLDDDPVPKVIISASGMATGGRVLHHLKTYAPDARNTILFTGYQAGGTRGAAMVAGADRVKIHGGFVPIRAEVADLHMLSAHADADGLMDWLGGFEAPPRRTFVVHGEPNGADALRFRISEELGWDCEVPELGQTAELALDQV